jgi:hypothetical protein
MALKDYSILLIGAIIIPLSSQLTATISTGVSNRKNFAYKPIFVPAKQKVDEVKINGEIKIPAQKARPATTTFEIKGEDAIEISFVQSNNSVGNEVFTILNSVLAVAVGLSKRIKNYDEYNLLYGFTDAAGINSNLNAGISGVSDLLEKQLTICSYFPVNGFGTFFNYRLIDFNFSSDDDKGTSTLSLTFSNYYNAELTNEEQEKINNTTKS